MECVGCVGLLKPLLPYLKSLFPLLPYLKPLLDQLRPYESRVRELAKGVNDLRKKQIKVQQKVEEEEIRYGRAIDIDVIDWLKSVEEIISEYENFNRDEDHPYAACSNGYLPKPGIRCRLSRIVNDITKKVNVLLQAIKHDDKFSYWRGPPSFDVDFHNSIYEIIPSRNQIMADIMAALVDSDVRMIGVYGWSGVGKTTLVKEVAKEALFDVGIMVKVTRDLDIREIQGQIADRLGMKLEEESVSGRAARIRERLNNPKESTLVILDDLRVKLDFNMLGFPNVNNEGNFDASSSGQTEEPLTSYKGCKILMISDSKQLLLSQMDGKGSPIFHVGALEEKEAEMLFKTQAEIGDENSEFQTLAAQIAKKCNGLPVTIVTTARALKNKGRMVWEDAYRKLERLNLTAVPELSTKLSYDLLENEELKHIFLICARMGHDALISDLVRYCIGLGLLQGIYTVREARDRVHALVGKLKELNLLSNSFSCDRFTMQDVIRDAALSIASQHIHAFVLTKRKLDEWPDQDKLERYTAISLNHCDMTDIMEEFPQKMNCSRLKVFHLDNSDSCLEIPDNFFSAMKELWVLILTGIHLFPLPSSIESLKKLRMLCLEQCKLEQTSLSMIGGLKNLRVLSLSGSDIRCLPDEFKQLAKLQIFDISNCFHLEEIPAHVLSSLTSLEELYMGNSFVKWKDETREYQGETASLSELGQLNQLTTLDIHIPKSTSFPKNLFFDKLDSYKIIIGDFNAYQVWDFNRETHEASKFLALQLDNIHSRKEIKILFERVEYLLLGQLNDVEDIFNELNCEGFPYLKYLSIVRNSKVKSIIDSKNQNHDEKAFPKLVSLFLYEVNNMEHICHSRLTNDSFCKLKIIKLKICGQLKNAFFSSMIKHLKALETVEVSECNSLKEIVTLETHSTDDKINFPELRFLTLQSLSEFIGFCSHGSSTREQVPNRNPNELFSEKVAVPKLERIELSSIKIHKIWSDQPSSSYFQNLIQLDVNDCGNLNYLLSFPMAKRLTNLQSLFVSECRMMENIIQEEVGMIELQESIFPKLKIIKLSKMKRLGKIWHSKISLQSFGELDALTVEGCNKLENVFPSYKMGRFRNLCNLRVTNCKSMKEIFDLKGSKQNAECVTKLQNVHVEALPKLEHVWNRDPGETLHFDNLQRIRIQECPNLKNIFPISIAMSLKNLEYLEVSDCGQIKEIVAKGETINNNSSISFEFPKLTTTRFSKLTNLECFYGGTHELSCSALNDLSVELCRKLKLFRIQNADQEIKPVFLPKAIYNLKSMQIEAHDTELLRSYIGTCRMRKLEEFRLSRLVDTEVLYFFLHRNPSLKSLLLSNCFFKELVPPRSIIEEKSGVVPKLNSLKLINLPSLKMIGFEEDTILFRRLECLLLKECPCLSTIAPSSVSFSYLTYLEVSNCNKLSYLMEPSTAKTLVRLTTMKVIQCESMQTIVSNQVNKGLFIFGQLKEIELIALHKLESFCNSNYCAFEFPLLEKFVVSACSNVKSFIVSQQVKTPCLRQICVTHEKGEKKYYWVNDINTTIQHLGEFWALDPDNMQASNPYKAIQSFGLKTLNLVKCMLETPHAIPTAVFPSLRNLEELEVSYTSVEVIFDNNENGMKGYLFPLKKLTLDELPNLKHVWDQKHEGILCFQNLHQVVVTNCESLKTLFPKKLAKKLEKLEKLEIRCCKEFLQIVEEENATADSEEENATTEATEIVEEENATTDREEENATTEATEIVEEENATTEALEEFLFPDLTSLHLCQLPELTNFYPGRFTLECPDLDHLEVLFCDKLETFQSQQETRGSTSFNGQPLFSKGKVSFNLESLKFDWKNTMMLCNGKFLEDMLFNLVELELDFDDFYEVSGFPIELLEKASDLECVQIKRCRGLKELFPSWPKKGEIGMLGHLKMLSLDELHELESIGLQHEWLEQVCNKLQILSVSSCPSLPTLVPSAVSFSNLRQLFIKDCHGLKHLFTSSTAKMLVHLEEMNIVQCNSMEKILAEETDESTSEAIIFERLNTIVLDSLFSLVCFYSGSDTLQLLSLIKVLICQCPNMEIFSQGVIHAEYFLGIKVSLDPNEDLLFHIDLNTTVKEMFQRQLLCFSTKSFHSSIHETNLHIAWVHENFHRKNLNAICEKLHQLLVSECPALTALVHSPSTVSFSYLKKLYIIKCHGLLYLFTSSTAKMLMHLEYISVEECDSIKEIVAKEQEEITSDGIKFERLGMIVLSSLSSLKCFYSGIYTLDLPSLIQVKILQCPKLDNFSLGLIDAKSFEGIQVSDNINEDLVFHDGLNSSVKSMFLLQAFLQAMDIDCLFDDHPELQEAWFGSGALQNKWLRELVTLKLSDCILPYAIPSCILPYLKNLKELEVRNSHAVKVIFDMNHTQIMETEVQLEKLHLEGLSELTRVWEKNSQGVLIFQNLQHVIVKSCENLKTLFPAALAKNLKKLKELKIESCDKLLDIVEKEEDAAVNVTENFVFPCLKTLDLNDLPQFTYFYTQTFTLECPALNNLKVLGCPKLELFQSAHPEGEGEGGGTSINRQPHISYLKVISNLEELSLDWKHISALSSSIRSGQFIECFKYLDDISLYFDDADENEEPILPTEVLQKAPNLKEMRIEDWKVPNVFLAQNLKIGDDGMLGQLEVFTLDKVSELQSINSEDSSWLNAIYEKLHKLNVFECPDLTTLIPSTSTVSFSCLRELHITECLGLQYLFTSSAAKMLMNIEAITVEECESMKKIVAKDDETTSEGIRFEQLRNIYLIALSSLECFYLGDDTLQLSSLIQVKILRCPKMEIFSQGLIHAKSFRGIQTSLHVNDELVFYEDLNTSVKMMFLQQDSLVVWDSPMLKEIWLGYETVPDWCFRNLYSLVVESCEFLSNAILPSHLLPLLHNLRELQVLKCNSVKSIFGHSKMGSQGSQSLPSVEELNVEDCEELVEIVAKEAEPTEEANKGLIIFPSLTSLKLSNLPNLRSIYSGMCMLEWPLLIELEVSQCQKLNFFTTEFQKSPDSHLHGQDSFQTEQQAIVSLEKVTPHLEKLSLSKKEALMIEQGKLCVDLPVVYFLRLRDFHDESDEFPFAFYLNATFTSCFKQLVVSDSAFKEIFPSQTFNIEYAKIFSQLKQLHIVNLSQLESIGLEHSWVQPFLQNLDGLLVRHCDCLTNLTPSTVSFSSLKELSVYNCHGLKYLFTSSTAKSLAVLKMIHVTNCNSIKEIVAEDEDEYEDDIIFEWLYSLTLESLPELTSFYSGRSTLNLGHDWLKVSLSQCNNMEVFSHGDVVPKNLEMTINGVSCKGDINSTIYQAKLC